MIHRRLLGRACALLIACATTAGLLAACQHEEEPKPPTIVDRGRQVFFNETFGGNGRTCGTCHRAEDNFGLTPAFIATLPPNDPLFVAETNPALAKGFEAPRQMRAHGLIMENLDGFEDLENKFTLRGVPHTLALRTSVTTKDGARTGWSGDGAPGDGTLRSFAVGAVVQHFTKTTNRVAGQDFRLPTDEELDALEAFMLSLGRQQDLTLPLPLRDAAAQRGQTLFMDNSVARCNVCHFNAGGNANPAIFGEGAGNRNFNTGVEDLPDLPSHKLADPKPPRDDGFGITPAGDGTFNTPPLVEAADTGPFFHNNARATLEEAVAFYNSEAFNNSPAGRVGRISLTDAQVREIAAFLRVINALENIRAASAMIEEARASSQRPSEAARLSGEEIDDAIGVLAGANLHPDAQGYLREAKDLVGEARRYERNWRHQLGEALAALQRANNAILAPPPGDAKSAK